MEQIRQLEADSERYTTIDKAKGLPAVKNFLMTQGAKIGGYDMIPNVSQNTHNQIMAGNINTLAKLNDSIEMQVYDESDNSYSYVIQKITKSNHPYPIYIIDSIFVNY